MTNKTVLSGADDILSALRFNLDMDSEIAAGISSGKIMTNQAEVPDLAVWRKALLLLGERMAATPTLFDDRLKVEDTMIPAADGSDIRLRIYRPAATHVPLPVFYWMHGGGLMLGSPEQEETQMKEIAVSTGALVVSVDYRLAPEYPYPIPLEDCYQGLLWIDAHADQLGVDKKRIAVGGASAGGGLAAAVAMMSLRLGGPAIIHQSLTYPMLDCRNQTKSSHEILSLGIWDRAYNLFGWHAYLGERVYEHLPDYAIPALAKDLNGLPPAFIAVGSLDLFRDEDIAYALRLMEAGISAELHFYHGAVHGFDWHVPDSAMTKSLFSKRINALNIAYKVKTE
ncbi:alpha/beta hydrolase [Chitinophaga sp. CF418]|uniref:alpha/beta hydrolase n=1 Tax=Chitinophaga sp. CF418 TaxID=1855287 RepID=UPI00165F51EB|nr:alpha/beta hydrolase [Chitinophaga sp. CF418]